jgi:hypothetical protein
MATQERETMMHPTRTENTREARRRHMVAAQQRRVPELEEQARGYRLERQALQAAEMARMIASYHTRLEA